MLSPHRPVFLLGLCLAAPLAAFSAGRLLGTARFTPRGVVNRGDGLLGILGSRTLGLAEYGGVDGLLTIEDLIETVIGEIEDEHDTSEDGLWHEEKPGQYIVQSRAPLDEFEAEIGMKLAAEEEGEEIDTLGGLVFMLVGRVPARGEVIPHESGAEFEIVDADPRRIKRLRVRLPQAAA